MDTQYLSQCRGSSVQDKEGPKDRRQVEDDITQKGTGSYGERFDQRYAARDYRGDKYAGSCFGFLFKKKKKKVVSSCISIIISSCMYNPTK